MWEYDVLFDRPVGGQPMIWETQPTEARVGEMRYRTKTTKAGNRLEADIYPIWGREKAAIARAEKKNVSPMAMKRANEERAKRYLVQLADTNFSERDISITLTYMGFTPTYEESQKDVRNFLGKIKRARKKAGIEPLKYIYTIEDHEDGKEKRIHIHMIMNGGLPREQIENIWAKGYANCDRLQPNENGLEPLIRYMVKQQKNRRKWAASKNLKKPKIRVSDTKVSQARVKRIAIDYLNEAKEVMEKVYPGYSYVSAKVTYSDIVEGVYIRCVMRRRKRGAPE